MVEKFSRAGVLTSPVQALSLLLSGRPLPYVPASSIRSFRMTREKKLRTSSAKDEREGYQAN